MTSRLFAALAAVALFAATATAIAAPDDAVDRERLKKAALLPSVAPQGWYYGMTTDGRMCDGEEDPRRADAAALRARLKGDDSDADRWRDLASAYRRSRNASREQECLANAVAIFRRQAAAHEDDGVALASLGLALAAAGDGPAADEAIGRAGQASQNAWAGVAASADMLLFRALGKAAGRRISSMEDARDWFAANAAQAPSIDRALLESAMKRYGQAVAGLEMARATGTAAASVCVRRLHARAALAARDGKAAHASAAAPGEDRAVDDNRRAMELLPSDPYALTTIALGDAMSEPADAEGATHVQSIEKLPEAARSKLADDLNKLVKLTRSADAATAARASQGIGCINWFVYHDTAVTEAHLRKSVASDPGLEQSWTALVLVLVQDQRVDDLAKLCEEWMKTGATARKRMILGKALAVSGHAEGAEKEWRAAQALDPRGFESNLGTAVLVMQRAKDDADLREAARFLDAAAAALVEAESVQDPSAFVNWTIANAVVRGLSGDVDGAESAARRVLEQVGDVPQAREILTAIGR